MVGQAHLVQAQQSLGGVQRSIVIKLDHGFLLVEGRPRPLLVSPVRRQGYRIWQFPSSRPEREARSERPSFHDKQHPGPPGEKPPTNRMPWPRHPAWACAPADVHTASTPPPASTLPPPTSTIASPLLPPP